MQTPNGYGHLGHNSLCVEYKAIESLQSYALNARTHSPKQIRQIAESIKTFGFNNPVLIDNDGTLIAGHARMEAARMAGMDQVPVIYLRHLSPAQKRAYIIADNKLAENAGWDFEILSGELQAILELDVEIDLTLTGFETGEIDTLLVGAQTIDAQEVIPDPPDSPVSRPGDIWVLGKHRLICADATRAESYDALLGECRPQMIFTDPPYNVPINGHVCGNGKIKHEEFEMASGEMSAAEFTAFLGTVYRNLARYSKDGSLHYICMDWRHMREMMEAASVYDELKNLCVWNKNNGGMGSLYRSKHELVFVYKNGTAPHINNVELGKNGRYRTNVWDYAGVNSFQNAEDLKLHPTVKPVAMIQDAILDCTRRGDSVLDVFGGSGSTLIAAQRAGRQAFLMELSPKYVDVIIARYQKETGDIAVRESDGATFDAAGEVSHDK